MFGYPLQEYILSEHAPQAMPLLPPGASRFFSTTLLRPKVTSAIVASLDTYRMSMGSIIYPPHYWIDKALNAGNSGGPAIVPDTGHAFGFCTAFETMLVEQKDLPFPAPPFVRVPSLYGVVQSFLGDYVAELFKSRGIPISEDL
jgi:hypothetical protein